MRGSGQTGLCMLAWFWRKVVPYGQIRKEGEENAGDDKSEEKKRDKKIEQTN